MNHAHDNEHDHAHEHEGHGHAHGAHAHAGVERGLTLSFAVTVLFMVVEAVAGWLTNSLALFSDAGHMLTDAGALGLGLFAVKLSRRPPSATRTFGWRRVELLAALVNGLALWAVVGVILHEAYGRLRAPEAVNAEGMMAVAALGLGVNLLSMAFLHRHKDHNLNVKGAFLHVVADSLGSAGALAAGVVVWRTGWTAADPLVSVLICALILWSSWGLVRETVHALLLGVPPHIDFNEVEGAILEGEGVCCVYDLHIWTIETGNDALSAHIVAAGDDPAAWSAIAPALTAMLKERFGIEHATLQIEGGHGLKEERSGVCRVDAGGGRCALKRER
jgi:cobalt-zinc-cadmium efflux system protein